MTEHHFNNKVQKNSQAPYVAMFFLIWPFFTALFSLKNFRKPWAKNVIWAFTAFFGFAFVVGAENQGADITRYIENLQFAHQKELGLSGAFQYFLSSGEIDLLRITIEVLISRFTDHPSVLTTVYGIIFGYFFSRNMWFVLDRLDGKLQWLTILLIVSFFLIVPIWNINGFRMWTAAHIFIYGLFKYTVSGNKNGVWIAMASVLVHYSFVVPVFTLFVYIFVGNRTSIFMFLFIGSLFYAEFDVQLISDYVTPFLPEPVIERTGSYIESERIIQYREAGMDEELNWYALWYGTAIKLFISSLLVLAYFKSFSKIKMNSGLLNLFSFVILFYSIANFASTIPSGSRFISVINIAALGFLLLYFQNLRPAITVKRFAWIASPAALLFIIVSIRTGLYSAGISTILGNPFVEFFLIDEGISLNDILKSLI